MTRFRNWKFDRWMLVVAAAALLVLTVPAPAAEEAGEEELPIQLREELEALLGKEASKIYAEKNEKGRRFQRANFSKHFRLQDDGTYKVVANKDSVTDDRMKTERYTITLSNAGGKWEITDRKLEGSYEKLIRQVPGDEKFYTFDTFNMDIEGMKISSGRGSGVVDFLLGEPNQVLITGADLTYHYEPPVELPFHQQQIYESLVERHPEDFAFTPAGVFIDCDQVTCKGLLEGRFTGLKEATHADLDEPLMDYFDEQINKQRERRKESPFSGFAVPREPDHRVAEVGVKRKGKDQYISLYHDSQMPLEVYFYASEYGPLFGYPSEATRASGIAPYDIELRDDYNAQRYELTGLTGEVEVGLEDAEMLKGDFVFTMKLKKDVQEIPFALNAVRGIGGAQTSEKQAAITVNALSIEGGDDLTYVRKGASGGWVIFPEVLPAGTELKLRMAFQTRGSIVKLTPSYAYMDRSGWLPFVRFTDAIEDFDMTVRAPSRFKTLGVGTKVSEKTKGGVTTTEWKANSPVKFPTIIFGDYVEDTPRSKAEKFDGTEIPVTIHVDKDGMTDWGIAPKQLRPLAEQAVNALNIYREIYGMDYPYGKLDLVNDPRGFLYGQAPASIIYLGSGAFRGDAALIGSRGDTATIGAFTNSLVAHEVAHQWWGSLIGNANMRNYWFVESLAEYSSALFIEIVEGEGYKKPEKAQKAYRDHVSLWRREVLETDLQSSVQDASTLWSGDGFSSYRAAVYSKGPYAFHILRSTFGDEKFFAFLQTMAQELGGQEIVTRDIQRVAEQSFGGTMEWFFDQWIRGVGIPEYSFNFDYRQTEDGNYLVQGNVKQRVVNGLKKVELDGVYFRGIVPVTVLGKDKQEYPAKLLVEGAETPFAFKVPVEPLEITLNKYGEILSHPPLENRSW